MTVREMLARIDSRELSEWMAYERLYGPLGQQRDDHLAALIAATVANAFRDSKTGSASVSDFLPPWEHTGEAEESDGEW